MATEPLTTPPTDRIACESCSAANPSHKKFCGECGSRLWQPCHICDTQNGVHVTFCGHCGENIRQQYLEAKATIKQQLQLAKESCKEGNFFQATNVLKSIKDYGDTRLEKYSAAAADMLTKVVALREEKAAVLDELYANVNRELESRMFEAAARWMRQIPVSMRTGKMQKTADLIETRLAEITVLKEEVREALATKKVDTLLPSVERLCELLPGDGQLDALRAKLRSRSRSSQVSAAKSRLRRAVQLLDADKFAEASGELEHIAEDSDFEDSLQRSIDQAREICWLHAELKRLPFATPQAESLVKRFQRLRPNSTYCEKFRTFIQKAKHAPLKDKRQSIAALRKTHSHLSELPMTWWNGFAKCEVDPLAEGVLQKHLGRFAVAYGLALQGVDLGLIKTNLRFDLNTSMLRKLASRRPKATSSDAWGIDIGATGLKVVQLTREKNSNEPRMETATVVPFSEPLHMVSHEEQRSEIIADALQRLTEETDVGSAQAVIGISAPKTLGRFFSIPSLPPKKLADAIRFEAKHQIPLPDDEVVFDHHTWPVESGMHDVALIAAQRDQVRPLLEAFQDTPFQVAAVQSASVAIFNACHHEFLSAPQAEGDSSNDVAPKSEQAVAVLDVGAESSIFAIVSCHGLRFRNLPFGTFRLSQMLAGAFACNFKRAELMRTRLESNTWCHKVDAVLTKGFVHLKEDLSRTLHNMTPELCAPSRLIITGGGSNQHGVIRSLVARPDHAPNPT